MDPNVTPKAPSDSEIVLAQLMSIVEANPAGNVHGGTIMKLVDTAAGLADTPAGGCSGDNA